MWSEMLHDFVILLLANTLYKKRKMLYQIAIILSKENVIMGQCVQAEFWWNTTNMAKWKLST